MNEIKAYQTLCGKKFFNKQSAKKHELVCKCWANPNLKTCLTCKFGKLVKDSNGMEYEPQYLHTWKQWECSNSAFDYDRMFTQAEHDKTQSLNINCPIWESK